MHQLVGAAIHHNIRNKCVTSVTSHISDECFVQASCKLTQRHINFTFLRVIYIRVSRYNISGFVINSTSATFFLLSTPYNRIQLLRVVKIF